MILLGTPSDTPVKLYWSEVHMMRSPTAHQVYLDCAPLLSSSSMQGVRPAVLIAAHLTLRWRCVPMRILALTDRELSMWRVHSVSVQT